MPIIWRFLLGKYFKIFGLSLFSFIAVLLVTRLDEVAQFAALGAPGRLVLLFTLYQILYILPIAIPISCLIASIILYQNLSHTHELTALRSSGLGLRHLTAPVLLAGTLLALLNFYIVSEWTTRSHRSSKQMVNELKTFNPLLLLQNKQLVKLKDAYVNIGSLYSGEIAQDALIAIHNRNNNRLNLMNAQKLHLSKSILFGENVSLVSSLDSENPHSFDHLIIENQNHISTPANKFSELLKTSGWRLNNDHLPLPLLLVRAKTELAKLHWLQSANTKAPETKELLIQINKCYSEISRRLSAAIAALTFTFMGSAFGMEISRNRSIKGPLSVITLAALFLCSFFTAKSFDYQFSLASAFYLTPHLIIITLSLRTLQRMNKGIE